MERFGVGLIGVSANEVLEEELGVSEIAGIILEALTMRAHQSLLEIGSVPDPLSHGGASQERLTLSHELVST